MSPDTAHDSLPVCPFPKKANVEVPSPTEILLDDTKAWEIVRAGITILLGISDGAVASFPLVANAYRLKPGVVTVESALSYQLFAGNLFHYLVALYPEFPAEGAEAVAAFVRSRLEGFLVPFVGDEPGESVRAEVVEAAGETAGRTLQVTLRPQLKMQGEDVDFALSIAL